MDAQRGIARRMVIGLPKDGLSPAWEKDFAAYPPAGVIVFRRDFQNPEDLRRLTRHLRELARPRRIFIGIDEEGGWVSQLAGHFEAPPNALTLGRGAGDREIETIARVTGERLRALGAEWPFAPVADVHSQPRNPVIGARAFGAEASAVAASVAATVRGFRAAGVASCLKHFPGHGDTLRDSHLELPRTDASRVELEQMAFQPFATNVDADSVMTAHVVYEALDPAAPGTFSRAVTTDLLRARMGFAGVCITDALEMQGAAAGRTPYEAARAALDAGADLLLFADWDESVRRTRLELAKALTEGEIDRSGFDAARPRLAAFDQKIAEPSENDLARPLESLTPTGWTAMLEGIIERAIRIEGQLPAEAASLAWRIEEPAFAHGATLRQTFARLGVRITDDADRSVAVVAVASRVPLGDERIDMLRATCLTRPTILIGMQNDAFLDELPEAALRVSTADCTETTRRVVARTLAAKLEQASEARA